MNRTAVVILCLALTTSAYGMVFSWTDSAGLKHFSNRRDEIPERYRSKAKPLYPEPADSLPGQPAQPQPAKPDVAPAIQQERSVEPPMKPQTVTAPVTPPPADAPVAGIKNRRKPSHPRDE